MHNQHAGLSQVLADQRITERTSRPPMRGWPLALARRAGAGGDARGWWQLAPRWPAVAADSQSIAHTAPADRSEDDHVQTHPRPRPRGHPGGHEPGRPDRRRPRPATDEPTSKQTPGGHPPRARSARPGTSRRPPADQSLRPPTPGGRRPKARSASPGATRPASRGDRPNRAGSPAGASPRSGSWPLPWPWRAGWPPCGPAAGPELGRHAALTTVTPLDGAAAPTRQPHRLAGDGLLAYLAAATASRPCADPGGVVRTHPFAPDARRRPGKTPVRTALSPRYLIRMRPLVQVQPGPLHPG